MQLWGPGLYQFDVAGQMAKGIAFDFLEYDFAGVPFSVDDYLRLSMSRNASPDEGNGQSISLPLVLMYLDGAARFDAGKFAIDHSIALEAAFDENKEQWPEELQEVRAQVISTLTERCNRAARKEALFPGVKASPFCADNLIAWYLGKIGRDWNTEKKELISEFFVEAERNPRRYPIGYQFAMTAHQRQNSQFVDDLDDAASDDQQGTAN